MKSLQRMKGKRMYGFLLTVVMCMTCMVIPYKSVFASGYDWQKAVAYADTWGGTNRNPDYNSYSADCANFVSQCLYAGGLTTGSDWQPYNMAWNTVTYMVRAMKARGYQVIENPTAAQIYPGNPVIYQWKGETADWSHATICVGYDVNGTPIVNGHTSNRYHVAWNYGVGSANKMCTILINNGITTQTQVKVGDSFYAYINSTLAGKPLTNDGTNVSIRKKGSSDEEIRSQVWKFVRQEDGSYVIYNSKDNNVLDVEEAGTTGGTNVHVYHYWKHPAQHWYIYGSSGAYQLKAQCSDCLLDVANAETNDGTNIQMCMNNGNLAQKFDIIKVNTPEAAKVTCTPGTDKKATIINWETTADTSTYNVRITGSLQKDILDLKTTSCQVELPAGNYEVFVDTCNAYSYSKSNIVKFTVLEEMVIEEEDKNDTDVAQDEVNEGIEDLQGDDTHSEAEEDRTSEIETSPEVNNNDENLSDAFVESSEDNLPDASEESNGENVSIIPEKENEIPETSEESSEEEILTDSSVNITNQIDNSVKNTYISYIWNYFLGKENTNTDVLTENEEQLLAGQQVTTEPLLAKQQETQRIEDYQSSEGSVVAPLEDQETESFASLPVETKDNVNEEDESEEIGGIRLFWETDENGEFLGLFLRIVFPQNDENQVVVIRIL